MVTRDIATTDSVRSSGAVDLIVLYFEDHPVRVGIIEGDRWWIASDVCAALDVGNHRSALARLDEDEKGVVSIDTPGGLQEVAALNDPGLYMLTMGSRKPQAKRFKRWLAHDVTPAIEKHGYYAKPGVEVAPTAQPAEILPIDYESAVEALLLQIRQRKAVEAQRDQIAAELEIAAPDADTWRQLVRSAGPHKMADAAKALANDPLIFPLRIGQNDLFGICAQWGWCFKAGKRWRVYQSAVETGWLAQKIQPGKHPQVLMTTKGLWEARRRLLGGQWAPPGVFTQQALPIA